MDPIQSPGSSISSLSPQVIDHKPQFDDDYRNTEPTGNTSNATKTNSSFSIDYILSNAAKRQDKQPSPDIDRRPMQQQQSRAQHKIDKMQQNALVDQLNVINMNQQQAQLMAHLQTISAAQSQAQATNLTPPAPPTASATYPNALAQLLQQIGMNNGSGNAREVLGMQQANSYFMACMLIHQYQQQQQQQQQANLMAGQQAAKMAAVSHQQQQQQHANQNPIDSLALLARLTNSTAAVNWLPTTSNYSYPQVEANSIQTGGKIRTQGSQRLASNPARRQPYTLPARSQQGQQQQQQHHLHQFQMQSPPVFPAHPRCLGPKSQAPCNPGCPPPPTSSLARDLHFPKTQHSQERPQSGPIDQGRQQFWNCQQIVDKPSATFSSSSSQQMSQQSSTRVSAATSGAEKLDNLKPAHSYIGLIAMCILSDRDRRMVLNDIYQYILDHYPYYRNRGSGWRNSVRHNLSLNECFQKAGRAANGKGHYWTIHPANMEDFMNGDFRRRRAQRKVRRFNNMDVPSDESDDESMEDATRPPLPEHFKQSIEMHKQLELEARMGLMQGSTSVVQQQLVEAANKQRQELMARAAAMAALSSSSPLGGGAGMQPPPTPVTVEHRATPVKDLLAASQTLALPAPPRAPLPIEPGPLFSGNQ